MQHLVVQALCLYRLIDLHITGMQLIGMCKKLKPIELCCYILAHKRGNELIWSMVHNKSKARWGPVVYLICFCWHEVSMAFTM